MSAHRKLRIAVLGCGRMGQRHAYNIQYLTPRAELAAVADPSPSSAAWVEANLPGVRHFSNPDDIFGLKDVDALVISTTTDTHAPLALKAMEADLHVLLEKPISIDIQDSIPVVEAANAKPKLKVMIGFVRRFDRAFNQLHDHLRAFKAGKPFLLKSTTCDSYDPSGYFVAYAKASGGIFMDCGIHDIDMARWLLNIGTVPSDEQGDLSQSQAPPSRVAKQVQRVIASGNTVRHPELVEQNDCDNALGIIEFTNGSTCTLHLSRTGMNGYESTVDVYGLEQKLTVETPPSSQVFVADANGRRFEKKSKYVERFGDAFLNEIHSFVDTVLDDKPVVTTPDDALQAALIAKALSHSYLNGKAVEFDDAGFPILN